MAGDSDQQRWPLVARWKQSKEDGTIHWYLAGLHADGRYWGYAHFRLESRRENRSFAGTLDSDELASVAAIIDELAASSSCERLTSSMGLIGIGTRASCDVIFELPCQPDNHSNPVLVAAYSTFIELLQSAVTKALADEVDENGK